MQRLQICFMIVVVVQLTNIAGDEYGAAAFLAAIFILYAVKKFLDQIKD